MNHAAVVSAIESFAPVSLQEQWDNSGVQVGSLDDGCTGVLLCVDPVPDVIREARQRGCNLVISHHPLLFKGLRRITGATPVEQSVTYALRNDICIYSCHTPADTTADGVSHVMAQRLGAQVVSVLAPHPGNPDLGLGMVAVLPGEGLTAPELVGLVKATFHSPVARCTRFPDDGRRITRIALCGGSGSEFIPDAIRNGAQAFITSDTRYHDFVDYQGRILIVDIGHFESEACTKQIFYDVIRKKFPNFACYISQVEENPIKYI